jgi:uracil-DNA glycosylase
MSENEQKLAKLKQKIADDNVCPELKKQATQMVFGDGNPEAEIVFIGEAPGKKEDEQGLPFVGAAGKFLNQMLDSMKLKRKDIYITNIVKYRPPANRDPLPEEKKDFLPYLFQQLAIIKPKLVVTLGRHSMNCFLPELSISAVHGQPKRIKVNLGNNKILSLVIMPLFHPAAALYNGGMRSTLIEDFNLIPSALKAVDERI